MIETISPWPSVRLRHESAPLLKEREQYLIHLLQQGYSRLSVRNTAAYLVHVVRVMNMNSMRLVPPREIEAAGQSWAAYEGPLRKKVSPRGSPRVFVQVAQKWLRFHGQLETTPPNPFHRVIAEFIDAMRSVRGLAPDTVHGYSSRAFGFLKWFGARYESLEHVSLRHVDDFLASKRAAGWSIRTIASQCQALRTFFRYAEIRGWCAPGLALGIRSPRIPKYDGRPKAPTWAEVRRLIESANGSSPSDLRAKAVLLLLAIYGLRSSEVSGLQLSDFDWRSEIFSVKRAKRGGVQQYPIQYEVGEAIIQYLQKCRKRCASRHVFVSKNPPYGPIRPGPMWQIVGLRMRKLGIQLEHVGPHSLRHGCATRLLQKGASLQEIADFLGHRDIKSIGIYARYDIRSLRKVAAFSLAGVR
ncbi:MAG: site-specific integrase [Acidobacteriia bacterium]|nr:site-specific integrase [Terriglobia bacterium]